MCQFSIFFQVIKPYTLFPKLLPLKISNTILCKNVFTWCIDKFCKAGCISYFDAFLVVLCVGGLRWLGVTHVTYLDRTYLAVARLVTQIDLSVKLYNHGEGSY